LPQAARHLTSEEDSYGNEKGSQEEIQQLKEQIFAFPLITEQRQEEHSKQQREKEHARFRCKEVQLAQIQL
jgi:hypothetical protein